MSISIVNSLTCIWADSSLSNDYSCLSEVVGKFGVYIFRDPSNGNVLYVGEAREQDLADSICKCTTQGIPHDFIGCPVA